MQLFNTTPSGGQSESCLSLNLTKVSKIFHFSDNVLKPKKVTDEIERSKNLIDKNVSLAEYKRRFGEMRREQDLSFYAYVLKVISSKSSVQGE